MKGVILGLIAFVVWSAFSIHHYNCNIFNLCNNLIKNYTVPFSIDDKAGFKLNSNYNLQYEYGKANWTNNFDYLPLEEIKQYLVKNKAINLVVIGKAFESEENNSQVAEQRAINIKNQLVEHQINAKRIKISKTIIPTLEEEYDFYSGLTNFKFQIDSSKLVQLKNKSINLYFEFGKDEIEMTDSLLQYFKQVKLYLNNNKTQKALLTGHTDDIGNEIANNNLGLERANVMKNILVELGINKSQISVYSKGELQPIADNTKKENRRLNRRVEIIIN